MIIAHKIALDPNAAQESYFARACGTARFAYNWALAEWKRQYLAAEGSLRRKLNSIKDEQFPWMRNVTKNAPQQAIKNLGAAFKNFFAGTGKDPKFKKDDVTVSGPTTALTKITLMRLRLTASASNSRSSVG